MQGLFEVGIVRRANRAYSVHVRKAGCEILEISKEVDFSFVSGENAKIDVKNTRVAICVNKLEKIDAQFF